MYTKFHFFFCEHFTQKGQVSEKERQSEPTCRSWWTRRGSSRCWAWRGGPWGSAWAECEWSSRSRWPRNQRPTRKRRKRKRTKKRWTTSRRIRWQRRRPLRSTLLPPWWPFRAGFGPLRAAVWTRARPLVSQHTSLSSGFLLVHRSEAATQVT